MVEVQQLISVVIIMKGFQLYKHFAPVDQGEDWLRKVQPKNGL